MRSLLSCRNVTSILLSEQCVGIYTQGLFQFRDLSGSLLPGQRHFKVAKCLIHV